MHKTTKLTPVMRKEVYRRWKKGDISLRALGSAYHVDKKVIQRIIVRGAVGDFSVHTSANARYQKPAPGTKKRPRSPIRRAKKDKNASS